MEAHSLSRFYRRTNGDLARSNRTEKFMELFGLRNAETIPLIELLNWRVKSQLDHSNC